MGFFYAMTTAIFWFRLDLRLSDNPAFLKACDDYDSVLPIYIDDSDQLPRQLGEASRVWLHHSLLSLKKSLQQHASDLVMFKGSAEPIITTLCEQLGADAVLWNRCYEPQAIERDTAIKAGLLSRDIEAISENASLFYEPWQILKKDQTPYRVFTPYWKMVYQSGLNKTPCSTPQAIPALPSMISEISSSVSVADLGLLPAKPWPDTMLSSWRIGEAAAQANLTEFLERSGAEDYKDKRDLPAVVGTSKMSPHLHFGEISPRQIIWQTLAERPAAEMDNGTETFVKEVIWREFAHYIMYHFPDTQEQPMFAQFNDFPWRNDIAEPLKQWQQGQTGFPIIDAGMRELWQTGWMHNRVRMVVASFLTKNLLISWKEGEAWFRDTLVDADFASNVMGWQWASGCGADAAPFFRIFNPVRQSEKFDGKAEYIRRWVPELSELSDKEIHEPWLLSETKLAGINYPEPMVDLSASRQRALAAYAEIKKKQE